MAGMDNYEMSSTAGISTTMMFSTMTTEDIDFNGWRPLDLGFFTVSMDVVAILFYLTVNLTMLFFVFAFCQKQLRLDDLKEAAMFHEKEKIEKQLASLRLKTDNLHAEQMEVHTDTDFFSEQGEDGQEDDSESSSDAWQSMVVGGGIGRKTVVNVNPMVAAQAGAASPRVIVTESATGAIPASGPASPISSAGGSQFFMASDGSALTLQAMAQMDQGSFRSLDGGAMSLRGSINQRNDGWDAMTVVSQRGLNSPSSVEMTTGAHGYGKMGDSGGSVHVEIVGGDDTMSCAQGIDYYVNRLSLYLPILLHFWDMATDIGVLISWVPFMDLNNPSSRCYKGETESDSKQCIELNTLWFVVVSVVAMMTYRVVSGIMYARKYSTVGGFFQFLDIMLFVEVYVSLQGTRTKSTLQLRWIRRMEAIIEATPQSFLQLIYLLQTGNTGNRIIQFSLAMAVMSVANSLVKSDEWNFDPKTGANQKVPPHPAFVTRLLFRVCEVFGRLVCLAFLTQAVGYPGTAGILCAQFIFYWVMRKDSFLGKDVGNIVEVLIAHPNLSLRLDEEHSHGEPFFGCLLRTLMCWTPVAFAYNMCNVCKSKWCSDGHDNDEGTVRQFSSDPDGLDDDEDGSRGCWQFNACMNRNVVTVHFTHRFLEEVLELSIVYFLFFDDNFKKDEDNPGDIVQFRQVLFAFGTLSVFLTPVLYFIVRRWLISGGKTGGIEMNVFGFLRQAHVSGDDTLLMEFVTRVPRSVNQQKKGSERTVIHECIDLNNIDLFLRLCKTKKVKLGLADSDGITPLIACARRGLQKHLALLLNLREEFARDLDPDRRIKIEARYAYRKTALMTCCEQGYPECIALLLDNGADINAQDGLGRTPMHYAIHAESHYRNMMSLLHLDKDNPSPAAEEYRKMNADEKKAKRKEYLEKAKVYEQVVTLLCQYHPNLELRDTKKQWTTLLEAAAGGNLQIVARLIHMGANMDVVDALGQSVLHVAVRCNSPRVLHYILTNAQRRWNHEHQNSEGDTPLRLAVHGNYLDCLRVLAPFEKPHSLKKALLLAVKRNRPQIVHFLLKEFKINPNFRDKEKMTPLRWAAYYGYTDCVKYLLMYKASDELDAFGQNIVFYAAKKGHISVLEVLEQANAHFGIINHEGQSALEKAFDDKTRKHINAARKRMRAKKAAGGR